LTKENFHPIIQERNQFGMVGNNDHNKYP